MELRIVLQNQKPKFRDDLYFMQRTIDLAKSVPENEVPVAAIIVKDDEILAEAINTRERDASILGHAEINAIEAAAAKTGDWNLDGATIYVNLEPCSMCAGAILQAHIKKVVWGVNDAKSGAFGSRYNLATKNMELVSGVMERECLELLREFFESRR
ncbi:MAG: nucleoside deaminase [Candidatus Melainabacteria bacterium]|nr:nucleoside deaminase [Candidatus Melainabacteria bacterium]